ncbi:DUF5916 domain-containing protein [Cochleicola gelatinilyticus]|nr:DUF5916 domain-containing protein [Cochleicola gelatinilyticus]
MMSLSALIAQSEQPPKETIIKPIQKSYLTTSIASQTPPELDGIFNEPVWDLVDWATDYVENQPDNGTAPTEQTKFKIIYDEKNLYIAVRCYDAVPEDIVKRLSRRDGFEGDWVEFNIDSYNDNRTGFSFTISAAGVKGDEFISQNGNNWDGSWNPIWYVKTQIDEKGWTAEMRIPLSQLRFSADEEQVWGLQSTRRYFRAEERSLWQPVLPNAPGWVSEFGELRGIKGIKPQKQLEVQPYTVTQLKTYPEEEGNPFRDGSDARLTGGVDAKIGITNDLTLDLTINPDFGQVDADPGAIALDGFEIFFEERRPFFVENKNIFDYSFGNNQDNLFFSRRIGRSPQGSAFGATTAYVDQPENTTILGAAKFSGKTKDGWSVGVLESLTSKEFAEVINEDGSEVETLVEPLTNYFVGRAQKDFNDRNSYIGGIFTATNRKMEPNLGFLHDNAYSGGIDFKHNWNDRTFYIEGNTVLSQVNGTAEAITETQRSIVHLFQREGASHVAVDTTKTSLTGTGGRLEFGKGGGGNWRYNIGGVWRSPELELNDIGFLRRADDIQQYAGVTREFNKPTSWYRRANIRAYQSSNHDFEGNYNQFYYQLVGFVNFKNNWFAEAGSENNAADFNNSVLRGGPRFRNNGFNLGFLYVGTDSRKKLSTTLGYVFGEAREQNFGFTRYEVRLNYQPLNSLNVSMTAKYESRPDKTQYVAQSDFLQGKRYITAAIDQETISTVFRVNYTINPNLSIQYYGEPFIARGKYSDFNYVNNPIATDLSDRVTTYTTNQIQLQGDTYSIDENTDGISDYSFGKPDFAFVQYRSNLVVRWEYIPGSEVFFVWSQGINGNGIAENNFRSIVDNQIFGQKPENIFLIKATYRFVL